MNTIIVHMGENSWTGQALHLACALARNTGAEIALLRLIPVQHMRWVGTDMVNNDVTSEEYELLRGYAATAEDYGVTMALTNMQYQSGLGEALADAADNLNASVVFAALPESTIPYWHQLQTWLLERRLTGAKRTLYTLEREANFQPTSTTITVRAGE